MTDRHAGYLVTLDRDIREDDAREIISALAMVKGVVAVRPVKVTVTQQIAEDRRDGAWADALHRLARNGPQEVARQDR